MGCGEVHQIEFEKKQRRAQFVCGGFCFSAIPFEIRISGNPISTVLPGAFLEILGSHGPSAKGPAVQRDSFRFARFE